MAEVFHVLIDRSSHEDLSAMDGRYYGSFVSQMATNEMFTILLFVEGNGEALVRRMELFLRTLGRDWSFKSYSAECDRTRFEIYTTNFNMSPKAFLDSLNRSGIKALNIGVSVTKRQTHRSVIPTRPRLKESVTYVPTTVSCAFCKEKFPHTLLVDTTNEAERDPDDCMYGSACTCPRCGAPDCCELVFEEAK